MENSPLFRPEVLESRGSQWLGAIRVAQPVSIRIVAGIAVAISFALIAYIAFGSINKRARVIGITTPMGGSLIISSPAAGTLVNNHVHEGQQVAAGQVLFELFTDRQSSHGEISALIGQQLSIRQQTLSDERRARMAQSAEKRRSLDARIENFDAESIQLEGEISLAQRRQNLAQQSLKKFEALYASGFVSDAQRQEKQEDLIDVSARLNSLGRLKVQLEANRLAVQAERDALVNDLATLLVQLDRAEASLRQEVAENGGRGVSVVTAPQAGTITTISNERGQTVGAGQVLANLIPASDNSRGGIAELEVHLYAPSRTAGFVATGQAVLIRYQAFPYQKFGLYEGTVIDVSKTPFAPNELPPHLASTILSNVQQSGLGFNGNEALYRIKVRLARQSINAYGKAQMLKPGMTLDADILQEERRIWEWIIDPLLAVVHR